MGIVTAARGLARYHGISHLSSAAIAALKPLDFHVYMLHEDEAPVVPVPMGVSVHADAIDRLRRHRKGRNDLPNEFWRDEINGATTCFVSEVNEELASVSWMYAYPAKRSMLVLAPGDAECSGAYVLPAFRGRGLYGVLGTFLGDWWLSNNGGRVFAVVASNNPVSMRQTEWMGYRDVAVLHRNSFFGSRFHTARFPHD